MIEAVTTESQNTNWKSLFLFTPSTPRPTNRIPSDFLLKITLALSVRLGYLSRPLS
jgi:hypothetical protein